MAKRFPRQPAAVICLLSVVGAALGSSCGNGSFDPTTQPEFLTPVAQAQEAGIRPYWLGKEFEADDIRFRLSAEAGFFEAGPLGPGADLEYLGYDDERGGVLSVDTYPKGGARETMRLEGGWDVRRGMAVDRDVEVGPWEAMVRVISSPPRPVNTVVLFVTIDDMVAEAMAKAGTSGVPGDDWNPLIDEDLLIEVVAENLRPYPE